VGHTGAGKTILLNLLSHFFDIDEGTIRIDGVDVRSVSRDSLLRQLGVVLQQTISRADQVIVIDKDRVIERGTHQALLDMQGAYHRLYQSQFRH
jgi:ABC-type multidrug transport system fused ATPase/permease subunit